MSKMRYAIYGLSGDETYSKTQFTDQLKKAVLGSAGDEFNFVQFDANQANPATIIDEANCMPMMADSRLVWVESAEIFDAKAWKQFAAYAQSPNETTCLVFLFDGSPEKAKKALSSAKETLFQDFPKPKPWELKDAIRKLAQSKKLKISSGAADLLAELVGDDLFKVAGELDKLALFKMDSGDISADDVAALLGRTRLVTRWELNALVGARELGPAIAKSHDIQDSGEDPIGLLAALTSHLRQLLRLKGLMRSGLSDKFELAKAIHLPPKITGDLMTQQARFSDVELRLALRHAQTCDLKLKSSRLNKKLLIDHFLSAILETGPYSPPGRSSKWRR